MEGGGMTLRTKVAIGLGSNVGNRKDWILSAWSHILDDVLYEGKLSQLYETKAQYYEAQPDFLNAVGVGLTEWKAPALVGYLKNLEREMGRTLTFNMGPREIDLDLIAFAEERWVSDGVEVPHPRMAQRDFVLVPMAELWPEWRHPTLLKSVQELMSEVLSNDKSLGRLVPNKLNPNG